MKKLVQAEGQDRNVFNTLKRCLRDIKKLDNTQLAILHFESWHEAKTRAAYIDEGDNE